MKHATGDKVDDSYAFFSIVPLTVSNNYTEKWST